VLHLRRTAGGRILDSVCLLLPAGPERLVTAVPAWRYGVGPGPAAARLARMLAERGVPAPGLLTGQVGGA
jgi:pilus assembly protein CpaF